MSCLFLVHVQLIKRYEEFYLLFFVIWHRGINHADIYAMISPIVASV